MPKKLTAKEHQKKLDERWEGRFQLIGRYVNFSTRTDYIDNLCGCTISSKPNYVYSGRGCEPCSYERKILKTHRTRNENCKSTFVDRVYNVHEDDIDATIEEYQNVRTNMIVKCNRHDHLFEVNPSALLGGARCPICALYDTEESKITNAGWENRDARMYVARFYDDSGEEFIKIGRTVRTVEDRYNSERRRAHYSFEVVNEVFGKLIDCARLERAVVEFIYTNKYLYRPNTHFDGCKNECMEIKYLPELLKFLKDSVTF